MNCPRCGAPLVQKNRIVLFFTGLVMIGSVGSAWFYLPLLAPSLLLAPVGFYFIHWSTIGRGLWCRSCKAYPSKTASKA
jgi:hypothetical protein